MRLVSKIALVAVPVAAIAGLFAARRNRNQAGGAKGANSLDRQEGDLAAGIDTGAAGMAASEEITESTGRLS